MTKRAMRWSASAASGAAMHSLISGNASILLIFVLHCACQTAAIP